MNFLDIFGAIGEAAGDLLQLIVGWLIQAVTEAIKAVGTWWMYLPAPVLEGSTSQSPAQRVRTYTQWGVTVVGVISMAVALIVVARKRNEETTVDFVMGFFRVILVTGAVIPGVQLVLQFSDEVSPWLLSQISGGTLEDGLGDLMGVDAAAASGLGAGIFVLLLVVMIISVLGGLVNMAFIMFSYGVLPVIVGLLPITAAYAMTERGRQVFDKAIGWLIALVLYKMVAAVIYGVGIAQARMITGGVEDAGMVAIQALYGCVLLCASAIALPALIRLVAPATAAGSRGGGGGQFLMGAAMVALGAVTGGAAAVAGKAAAGASSGAGAAQSASGAAGAAGTTGSKGAAGAGASSGSGGAEAGASGGGGKSSGAHGATSSGSGSESSSVGSTSAGGAGSSPSGASSQTGGGAGSSEAGASGGGTSPSGASSASSGNSASSQAERAQKTAERMRAAGAQQLGYHAAGLDSAVEQGE